MKLNKITKGVLLGITAFGLQIRTIVAVGCAVIRRVVEVAIRTLRSDAYADADLRRRDFCTDETGCYEKRTKSKRFPEGHSIYLSCSF